MKEILDEALVGSVHTEDKSLLSTLVKKTILYCLTMFGGTLFYWYVDLSGILPLEILVYQVFDYLLIIGVLSTILEIIRWCWHQWKEKKAGSLISKDPFWFQIIEGSFAIWILFAVFFLMNRFVI